MVGVIVGKIKESLPAGSSSRRTSRQVQSFELAPVRLSISELLLLLSRARARECRAARLVVTV